MTYKVEVLYDKSILIGFLQLTDSGVPHGSGKLYDVDRLGSNHYVIIA